ncbi:hypothetical protein FOZ61_010610 [Perkinsus olseni]|uniref:Uncharacterized protein n=1 Tax=Perkinsus olseni TaxID=32597 RepID=A0A7J6M2A5_PEROL|nr:hypothetical protein FOZ61_010610 [Perkinsus olseni]KAF4672032.1 hypothetical protein FOL46_009579 [Perkinsus olseni]
MSVNSHTTVRRPRAAKYFVDAEAEEAESGDENATDEDLHPEAPNSEGAILLCWNSYGVVKREILTPTDMQLPPSEVRESVIEITYSTPGIEIDFLRILDSVYGWSLASISDKGVVLGAPYLTRESEEEDSYDELDFVTGQTQQSADTSTSVARVLPYTTPSILD